MYQILGLLVLVAIVVKLLPWIVAGYAVWTGYKALLRAQERARQAAEAHEAEIKALIERCDRQHAWVLSGDDRGTYGEPTAA